MLIPVLLACMVASYLIGGVTFGYLIGKFGSGEDIRTEGSGNVGATNALRVLGPAAGALTLLGDVLKGVLCVCASRAVLQCVLGPEAYLLNPGESYDYFLALICASALLGHMFSPYLGFHGGKGIAVGFGVCVAWLWPIGLSLWIPFLVGVVLTKYVSVGSIAAAVSLPVWGLVYYPQGSVLLHVILAVLGLLVVWAHRSNIKKLARNEESKLSFTKKDKEKAGKSAR